MKYPKVSGAANAAEEFEVLNEGTWLTEEHLQNLEAVLAENELATQQGRELLTNAEAELASANGIIAEREATIASLQAEIAELKKNPATPFEDKGKGGDPATPPKSLTPSIDAYASEMGY